METEFKSIGRIDAEEAIKKIDLNPTKYLIYRTSNENLEGFLPKLDMADKKVFSIAGSGDQYLTSQLYNPKEVVLYDISWLTKYYTYLKTIGFCCLSPEDFRIFFIEGKLFSKPNYSFVTYLEYDIYLKFRNYLPQDVRDFWDYLYKTDSMSKDNRPLPNLRRMFYSNFYVELPVYLKKEYHARLQEKLSQKKLPEFHNFDIRNIDENNIGNFDVILTSNIFEHVSMSAEEWKNFVINVLGKHLNRGGIIQAHYDRTNDNDYPEFSPEFSRELIESAIDRKSKDIVYLYKSIR